MDGWLLGDSNRGSLCLFSSLFHMCLSAYPCSACVCMCARVCVRVRGFFGFFERLRICRDVWEVCVCVCLVRPPFWTKKCV
jgi:hypothetical protein